MEVVRELLARGAAVNAAANDVWTPLYLASWEGRVEVVRELLARNASPSWVAINGGTALSIATTRGHAAIAALLATVLGLP